MNRIIRKGLSKVSDVLYRTHKLINKQLSVQSSFVPYKLHYTPSKSNKKIIHFNGNFDIGGSSQLIVDIIEHTSNKLYHKVVVPYVQDPLPYQPVDINVFSIEQLTGAFEFLKQEKPDLVHIHYWVRDMHRYEGFALWYYAIFKMCNELNIKVLQNINVPAAPHQNPCVVENVYVSDFVLKSFDRKDARARVIYPGSDFAHFSNSDVEHLPENAIGMVYRLDRDKLNEHAIEVFIEAVKRKPDLLCYIIGNGYYYSYYIQQVRKAGLMDNFIFLGVVSYKDLPGWYKKFSVFVAPVHDESFGQVTPFAMSMGLAVAGYNTGALKEILGSADHLATYGGIGGLADTIVKLASDTKARIALGKLNQQRAHNLFSVKTMVDSYQSLYDQYLG